MIQGEGDPLVLLHGALGTGTAHFREQIDEFALSHQVITPDFLGYGKSGRRAVGPPSTSISTSEMLKTWWNWYSTSDFPRSTSADSVMVLSWP